MSRVIFLVDMNAFYISCESTRQPQLAKIPAAVAGNPQRRAGIILAANYPARKFGVKTAMVVKDALKLCPQLELVPPDHDFYAEKSGQVMQLLAGYTPMLEQNSIDEAWLDMTGCAALSGQPLTAAARIMRDIEERLGLICSIGIAENKFLAKMAAELKKPRGITWLKKEELASQLWPLPVRSLYGVGQKTAARLAALGVQTIADLIRLDKEYLETSFGKAGTLLYEHARGIDDEPVTVRSKDDIKSISRMTTLGHDLTDLEQAETILLELAADVGLTARSQDKRGQTVFITLKFNDFSQINRQLTVLPTSSTQDIYRAGCCLLQQNWSGRKPIRLLGIGLGNFASEQSGQQITLFDLPGLEQQQNKLDQTMDMLREKYGESCLTYGKLLQQGSKDKNNNRGDQ